MQKSRTEHFTVDQVAESLEDMKWFADRWMGILCPSREPNLAVARSLASLKRFGTDTPYPFILNLFCARDRDRIVESDQFAELVSMLESFLVRRMFANVSTNQLNRLFTRLWDQLPEHKDIAAEVRQVLSEPSRRWPADKDFRQFFVTYPLYTDSQPQQRRLVLDRLERSYGHKEAVVLDELQIEHIMPQTLTDDWRQLLGEDAEEIHRRWLHTSGNLTLTGYNPEMSNASWPEKRDYYAASNVSMTRALAAIEVVDEKALIQRGQDLAERAMTIWPGPF